MAARVGMNLIAGIEPWIGRKWVMMGVDVDPAQTAGECCGDPVELVEATRHADRVLRWDETGPGQIEEPDRQHGRTGVSEWLKECSELTPQPVGLIFPKASLPPAVTITTSGSNAST